MEFQYTVNPLAECPIMLLTDDIGYDETTGKGIDGSKFLAELLALEAIKPKSIEIWINSAGGVVTDGYAIYSAILDSKVPVDTKCVGMAASIAAVIFQAGRNRCMNDYSWLMFHNPYGGDDSKLLNTMKGSLATMIARSGKSEEDVLAMMKRTTYIYADEAVEQGLADKVEASDKKNKKRLSQFTQPSDFHREVNLVLNKLFDKTPLEMSRLVTNKLGLGPEASEDSIVIAIDAIVNKAKEEKSGLEGKITDLQKQMDAKDAEYCQAKADLETEMDKLKKEKAKLVEDKAKVEKDKEDVENKLTTLQKEKDDAELATKEEKARNQVKEYAALGRIKDEKKVIDFWTEMFVADPDTAKEQIEALPLNKTAPVINKTETTGIRYTAGAVMAQINAKKNKQTNIN